MFVSPPVFQPVPDKSAFRPQGEPECESGTYPPPAERAVPHYVINLDLPPEYRYCKVMEDLGPAVRYCFS